MIKNNPLFKYLVESIIKNNGDGHKELEQYVSSGSVEKDTAEFIKFHANMYIIRKKLSDLLAII